MIYGGQTWQAPREASRKHITSSSGDMSVGPVLFEKARGSHQKSPDFQWLASCPVQESKSCVYYKSEGDIMFLLNYYCHFIILLLYFDLIILLLYVDYIRFNEISSKKSLNPPPPTPPMVGARAGTLARPGPARPGPGHGGGGVGGLRDFFDDIALNLI